MASPSPVLLYRETCGKCRCLSLAVVVLSLGRIRRLPIASREARSIYETHNVEPGKLMLVLHRRTLTGWRVLPGTLMLPGHFLYRRVSALAARRTPRSGDVEPSA